VNELVAWLLEQIDHDEQVTLLVGSAFSGDWSEERRNIVAQCQVWLAAGQPEAAEIILRLLAVPYADRPGYLELWRPS
jgi:hypothetical protein